MRNWFGNLRIKQKGLILFVLFITPVLLLAWIGSNQAKNAIQEQVGQTLFQLIKQNHFILEQVLSTIDQNTVSIIELPSIQRLHDSQDTEKERVQKYIQLQNILSKYSSSRGMPYSIFIPTFNEDTYYFAPGHDLAVSGFFNLPYNNTPDWYDKAVQERGAGTLQVLKRFGYNPNQENTVAYTRSIRSLYDADLNLGVLVVTELEKLLRMYMESIDLPEQSQSILLNQDNEVLYSTEDLSIGTKLVPPEHVMKENHWIDKISVKGHDWLYVFHYNPEFKTKLIYQVPVKSLVRQYTSLQYLIHIMSAIYLAMIGLFILSLAKSILKPLVMLTKETSSYIPGQPLNDITNLNRRDEIGMLNHSFQRMKIRLNHLIKEKYEMEIKQKETELMILHSQITPHLLYNTLDSIYWTGIKGGVPEVAYLVKDLAKLLRIGLSRGKLMITIAEELEHAEAYIRLQLKRYNNAFEVLWEVEEGIKNYLIPKVILQPLIENCILHGIGKMDNEGKIWVAAQCKDSSIEIIIDDNGFKAVDTVRINKILKFGIDQEFGFGIRNVNKRIQLHFGPEYGLTYAVRPAGGTRVIIRLPVILERI